MKIAVIGLGEVGRCYAKALHIAGFQLRLCDTRPAPVASALAATWELPIQTSVGDWLRECDWMLSCVTGAHALGVAEQCLAHAHPGAALCDLTTASPDTKRSAAKLAAARSIRYIDVAIMGAISLSLEKTPLLASGASAAEFAELLTRAGGNARAIHGGAAGDAIALKILRSVFTKGMEALGVELLMAAEAQGVREKLYTQLRDIDETPLRTFIDMLVRTHVIHARRRAHEVHDAAAELAKHGIPSVVLPGVEERFAKTIAKLETQAPPQTEPTIEEALAWLLGKTQPTGAGKG
ncbi:NAD(P)-dependent oxidoreductase [Verminephrobacter eiseniae]|uniref:6-phosphogluconate dehydrogenase, NAD-binding n=1 Tax=Verminephrobacter eiseniae (strain EF01-2) TaxID=391735 RepID=A1WMY0_VEREI|nr:NAD(P)-dependent oxidoreductase [Verminephrobacter eiseniae]ABM58987.1 6-phosphogluconate dehydrogenase, NAD-binding [Verminephrobacter eiseniae EF01-2]MCW5284543.1 NAD(P)-dependent oxidoreductase [Verminephrobacter eiseniae]MCW5302249.1 NAD(P)-dependent oxidoreductase [Verminephrobacter eiseniae]MCW8179887.1 NAD(P)-dependent oxidoreductase [Verminephrobacter eiseniae]MCW8189936.1 NAD(P)-dependent oxidoreductase [Verminephrobacter eiseniae]